MLPYLLQFHGKLGVLVAAWGKGEGTVQGMEPLASPAGAGQAWAGSLGMELLGSWVALLAAGDRQSEPPWWWQWWSPQLQARKRNMVSAGGPKTKTPNNSQMNAWWEGRELLNAQKIFPNISLYFHILERLKCLFLIFRYCNF